MWFIIPLLILYISPFILVSSLTVNSSLGECFLFCLPECFIVILPCSAQNFKMIGWLRNKSWANELSRDLSLRCVPDWYMAQHSGWIVTLGLAARQYGSGKAHQELCTRLPPGFVLVYCRLILLLSPRVTFLCILERFELSDVKGM